MASEAGASKDDEPPTRHDAKVIERRASAPPRRSGADGTPSIQALFWLAMALSALNAAYAAINARDLVYDGSYYLLALASHHTFQLFEPARASVQILQQLPVILGLQLGVQNLSILARLFSLGMSGWPLVLTALCWFALPRGSKSWIAGPLINLAFAIPAANFIGVSEGIIASCLLWLAVLLVMFRLEHPAGALAAFAASLACAVSHESAVLCLGLIASLAASRSSRLHGFCRIAARAIALVAALGAVDMARWIAAPRSTIERSDFAVSLFGGFLGAPDAPNMAAIASLVAAIAIAIALFARRQRLPVTVAGVVAVLACGIAFAVAPAALASPSRFFAARGLPVAITTVVATAFALLRRQARAPAEFAAWPAPAMVTALIFSQALMQMVTTNLWSAYVRDLRMLVTTRHGAISHREAMAALDPDHARFRRELLESWSVEPLSIVLAAGGQVRAIVTAAENARWVPYNFRQPKTLPRMPELDWSHFPTPANPSGNQK